MTLHLNQQFVQFIKPSDVVKDIRDIICDESCERNIEEDNAVVFQGMKMLHTICTCSFFTVNKKIIITQRHDYLKSWSSSGIKP